MSYAITTSVRRAFTESLSATRQALSEQGFGILAEIDMQATLKAKIDVDIPPQVPGMTVLSRPRQLQPRSFRSDGQGSWTWRSVTTLIGLVSTSA